MEFAGIIYELAQLSCASLKMVHLRHVTEILLCPATTTLSYMERMRNGKAEYP